MNMYIELTEHKEILFLFTLTLFFTNPKEKKGSYLHKEEVIWNIHPPVVIVLEYILNHIFNKKSINHEIN